MAIGRSCLPYTQHQRQKTRAIRERTIREKAHQLTRQDRRDNANRANEKQSRIWEDLNNHWRAQEALAEELAKKHNKTVAWMKNAIQRVGKYGAKRRVVSPYNAWLHAKSAELNDGLRAGEKADVIALQEKARAVSSWKDVSKGDMERMIGMLEEKRALVKKGIRTRPLSQLQAVRQAHKRLNEELVNLSHTCKISSFLVMVRTTAAHTNSPYWSADQTSKDFIEMVLGWDIDEFCLKYEAFALFRLKGIAMNNNDKVLFTRRRIRNMVRRGLREITGNKNLEMSWKNYETEIVDEYRVVLEGWPNPAFDPAKLGFTSLKVVLQALEAGECSWVKLTEVQFKERKEILASQEALAFDKPKKPRKERSDKGKKRGAYKESQSIPDDEDDESSD